MVHKALPARAVPCAANSPPAHTKLPEGAAGPSRLASTSFSGDLLSRGSANSLGCVSLMLAPRDRNPKSLKVGGARAGLCMDSEHCS